MAETIFALASAPGKSGVAVVRVSGPKAWQTLRALTPGKELPDARIACIRKIVHPVTKQVIDYALVAGFRAPASFTGEDVIEYHLHGSPAVIAELANALSSLPGCRMAEPGEFTRRAFENEKMDLTEAEAIADLINAETQAQKIQALAQMEGALSRLYDSWAESLAHALAYVEAVIDFPDEEVPDSEIEKSKPAVRSLAKEIASHLDDNRRGERLRSGVQVAVIGAPNTGKSSLVNALAQRDVAIVSDTAGTTRDVIEVHLDLGGFPVILADTAGLRPDQIGNTGQDAIESEGMRRALKRAEEADLRILLFDGPVESDAHTAALIDDRSLIVVNKSDLGKKSRYASAIPISVKTGEGMSEFLNVLTDRVRNLIGSREAPSLTRARHRKALEDSKNYLEAALCEEKPELMAESLRNALRALGRLTGRVDVEDLLDIIFRDFCIGK